MAAMGSFGGSRWVGVLKLRASLLAPFVALAVLVQPGGAAEGAYVYTLVAGPTQSIDGFSPGSLNEDVEVVYADGSNGTISTSTGTLAQVDDVIGGERLSAIPWGSGTAINDDGQVVFRARYEASNGADLDAIFTPTDLIARQFGSVGGVTVGSLSTPSMNNGGEIVFSAGICPQLQCGPSGIFNATTNLLDTPVSDGFWELRAVADPAINDAGLIAFYGYALDGSAVYRFRHGQPLDRVVHSGETVAAGVVLGDPRCCPDGLDLNENGDVATYWTTDTGAWIVLKNGDLVARAGDTIDGIVLTELNDNRPALNDDGVVVFVARYDGGWGVFTQTERVLATGQTVGGQTIESIHRVAVNESGAIAVHVYLESGFYAIVLATPVASNGFVQMVTGSSVALRQSVDVPSQPFVLRVDHRFATTTGQLNAWLAGTALGTVGAPLTLGGAFTRSRFAVSGVVLGETDVILEFELDGPSGSTLQIDNVSFPGLVDGTFESGDLSAWETETSGTGSVERVPEPSRLLSALVSLVTVAALARCSGRRR